MSKKGKSSFKVDWSKDRFRHFGHCMIAGENRISQKDAISMLGKSNYYDMKKAGYFEGIKGSKSDVKCAEKFRKSYTANVNGKSLWGGSGSAHSGACTKYTQLIPKSAMMATRFQTGKDLQREFEGIKSTSICKANLKDEKQRLYKLRYDTKEKFKNDMVSTTSRAEKVTLQAEFNKKMREIDGDVKILNDASRGVSPPDIRFQLTHDEAEELITNLRSELLLVVESRHRDMFEEAINKLESMISLSAAEEYIEVNMEITTENYKSAEIKAKANYEKLTGHKMIYLPAH